MKQTVISIVGARPQFIKAAMVSAALRAYPDWQEIMIHTGQHYDDNMSAIFFRELAIQRPEYDLGIGSANHGAQTGRMLEAIEALLLKHHPKYVIVYGDTNSTTAGALAAVKLHIPVVHVEAGLRSFNRKMPEEINRILTDHMADLLFCPTETAMQNARHEGIASEKLFDVGDVMYDAALHYGKEAHEQFAPLAEKLHISAKRYVLATIHRAENTDDDERLAQLFQNLIKIAAQYSVVLPLHPRTRAALSRINLLDAVTKHLQVIDPIGFLAMIALEKNAAAIITDSGGVQKEAYFYRVPCITVRDETEWVELVAHDWNVLVAHTELDTLSEVVLARIGTQGKNVELFGGGTASQRIAQICHDKLRGG